MTRATIIASILMACCCIAAAAPATLPSAEYWLDRARNDLQTARQQPPQDHRPAELELWMMLLQLRGDDRDRKLALELLPVVAERVVSASPDPQVVRALVATRRAQLQLFLRHPDADAAVAEAVRDIEALPDMIGSLHPELYRVLALCGKYEDALDVVEKTPFLAKHAVPSSLAHWLDKGGHLALRDRVLDEAGQRVLDVPQGKNNNFRDFGISQLAQNHAREGFFEAAVALVKEIRSPYERITALARIACDAHDWGQTELARETVRSAARINSDIANDDLLRIARDLRMRDEFLRAARATEKAGKIGALDAKDLARGYAIFGMRDDHKRIVAAEMRSLLKRRDGWSRREDMLQIAASYVYLGDELGVTHAIAASGLHPDDASYGLYGIIEAYVENDQPFKALALIEKWIQPDDRDYTNDLIAHALAKTGDTKGALRFAQRINEQLRRTRAIAAVLRAHVRQGEHAKVAAIIDAIQNPLTRATLNLHIAEKLTGRPTLHTRWFRE